MPGRRWLPGLLWGGAAASGAAAWLFEGWRWEGRLTALLLLGGAVVVGYLRPGIMWAAAALVLASVLAARWLGGLMGFTPSPAFSPWTVLVPLIPLLAGAWLGASLRSRGKPEKPAR
ncbi:MAG: hypothetical protein WBS54_12090 [Acidobacteriota bacterium]